MSPRVVETIQLDVAPEPWEYNPSAWRQRVIIALIAAIPFFISIYLGLYEWRLIGAVWDPFFGAQTLKVLDSDVSERLHRWFRMPDAILGSLGYLGDMLFALAGSTRRWQFRPWLVVLFGLDVIPLGIVSAILVVMQGAVVGAWCTLCLVTAVASLVLVVLAYDEVWSCLLYLGRVWRRSGSLGLLWHTFWGGPSEVGHEVGLEIVRRKPRVGTRR